MWCLNSSAERPALSPSARASASFGSVDARRRYASGSRRLGGFAMPGSWHRYRTAGTEVVWVCVKFWESMVLLLWCSLMWWDFLWLKKGLLKDVEDVEVRSKHPVKHQSSLLWQKLRWNSNFLFRSQGNFSGNPPRRLLQFQPMCQDILVTRLRHLDTLGTSGYNTHRIHAWYICWDVGYIDGKCYHI